MGQATLPQLRMEKSDLDRVPDIPLAQGYTLRTYRAGDEAGLAEIYLRCDLGCTTPEAVRERIVEREYFRPERVFIAECDNRIAGTAIAWEEPGHPPVGYLHMVGVHPDHRGHGLGRLLTIAAIRQNHREGFPVQRLHTDDFRLPAIRLYLDLGYYPLLSHPSHLDRWNDIAQRLARPDLLDRARHET